MRPPTQADRIGDAGESAAQTCEFKTFSGDTEVLMADGSTNAIAKVKVGDKAIATDLETGEQRV